MTLRQILEVLVVMGVAGLIVELAATHPWLFVLAGSGAAAWLLLRRA